MRLISNETLIAETMRHPSQLSTVCPAAAQRVGGVSLFGFNRAILVACSTSSNVVVALLRRRAVRPDLAA